MKKQLDLLTHAERYWWGRSQKFGPWARAHQQFEGLEEHIRWINENVIPCDHESTCTSRATVIYMPELYLYLPWRTVG